MPQDDRWTATGLVVPGARRGRAIGFPTANVELSTITALPPDGVYAGLVRSVEGPELFRAAAISVGTNPTFDGSERTVEAHLLDFDGDLYGRRLEIRSIGRLRGMVRYSDVDALIEAIAEDVAATRRLIRELVATESGLAGLGDWGRQAALLGTTSNPGAG